MTEKEIVYCGEKGRHYLDVPEGYERLHPTDIVTKELSPFCKVANIIHLYWMDLDDAHVDIKAELIGDYVICKNSEKVLIDNFNNKI